MATVELPPAPVRHVSAKWKWLGGLVAAVSVAVGVAAVTFVMLLARHPNADPGGLRLQVVTEVGLAVPVGAKVLGQEVNRAVWRKQSCGAPGIQDGYSDISAETSFTSTVSAASVLAMAEVAMRGLGWSLESSTPASAQWIKELSAGDAATAGLVGHGGSWRATASAPPARDPVAGCP